MTWLFFILLMLFLAVRLHFVRLHLTPYAGIKTVNGRMSHNRQAIDDRLKEAAEEVKDGFE